MKRILYIFALVMFSVAYVSCCKDDHNDQSTNADIESFVLHTATSNYWSNISEDDRVIRLSGIKTNSEIKGVSYKLVEGATIAPLPEDITEWRQEQQFEITHSDGRVVAYTMEMPDMVVGLESDFVVMGYISTTYAGYDEVVETINLSYITHLLIAHLNINADSTIDISNIDDEVDELIQKAHSVGTKVLMVLFSNKGSVANPLEGQFTDAIQTAESRAKLISRIIEYGQEKGFDGIDIDYEDYLDFDLDNLINFAKELRAEMPDSWMLTCANGPWVDYTGYAEYLDYVNVMSYGTESSGNTPSGKYATMDKFKSDLTKSMAWVNDKSKIVGGVPFYGWSWEESPTVKSFAYNYLIDKYPTATAADADNYGALYYNGRNTIREKCIYIKEQGYAGIMIWQLAQDCVNPDYRLLDVIAEEMMGVSQD